MKKAGCIANIEIPNKFIKYDETSQTNFLYSLLILAFYACRPSLDEDIKPQQELDISAIKYWYKSNSKITYYKNGQAQGDIYYPQWEEVEIHTLSNGTKLAVFPVHRELSIRYYHIGFVRRLAVVIDEQDSIISGQMLEMIGSKDFLRQNKTDIPRQYYEDSTASTGAIIRTYDIPQHQIVLPDKNEAPCSASARVVAFFMDVITCTVTIVDSCGETHTFSATGCDDGAGSGGGGGGSGTGGGSGGTGGGGGGNTNPPKDDCYTNGDEVVSPVGHIAVFSDCGGSGGNDPIDPGDNIEIQTPPENISDELKAILDTNPFQSNIKEGDGVWESIDEALTSGIEENLYLKALYEGLVSKGFKCSFDLSYIPGSFARYSPYYNNPGKKGIKLSPDLFTDFKDFVKVTLWAELTHAWMDMYYDGTGEKPDYEDMVDNHPINVECEQRFFIEYVKFTSEDSEGNNFFFDKEVDDGYTFFRDKPLNELLETWLKSLQSSPDGKPTEDNIQPKYFDDFMENWFRSYWGQFQNSYTGKPSDLTQLPEAILSLF